MNKRILISFAFVPILLALLVNQTSGPALAGIDPVVSYSGWGIVCERGYDLDIDGNDDLNGPGYTAFVIPFGQPPGYGYVSEQGLNFKRKTEQSGDQYPSEGTPDMYGVKVGARAVGSKNIPSHLVGSKIIGCEAVITLLPYEPRSIPYKGSKFVGDALSDYKINATFNLSIVNNKFDYQAGPNFYTVASVRKELTTDTDTIRGTGLYNSRAQTIAVRIDHKSGDEDTAVNADCLAAVLNVNSIEIIPKSATDYQSEGALSFDDNLYDDCAMVSWRTTTYYDISYPITVGASSPRYNTLGMPLFRNCIKGTYGICSPMPLGGIAYEVTKV